MNKIIIILLLCLPTVNLAQDSTAIGNEIAPPALVFRSYLQEEPSLQISVQTAFVKLLSGTTSYINDSKFSPVGVKFEYTLPAKYGFGVELSHISFQKRLNRDTYLYDGSIISSVHTRTLAVQPLVFSVNRYLLPVEKDFRPFAYLGLGISRIHYLNYWGIFEDPKKRISPTLAAGIGFKLSTEGNNYVVIDGKLKYVVAPFQYDFITKLNYLAVDMSIGLRWWRNEPE